MKRSLGFSALLLISPLALASHTSAPLDKVAVSMTARQWVSTGTALVTVDINATLSNASLVKVRADIMNGLQKIAAGEWHVTAFNRSQDSSGLEKLFVEAEARIPESSLTNLYNNAKNLSKPGTSFSINAIEFRPGLEEMQKARMSLRERLYRDVQAETARLNSVYPDAHYTLNRLIFTEGDAAVPAPQMMKSRVMNTMALAAQAPAAGVTVSNEIILTANAVLASNRSSGTVPPAPAVTH